MCTPTEHIKLCSCGGDEVSKNRWKLRHSKIIEGGYVEGTIVASDGIVFSLDGYIIQKITHDLNHTPVFDFDYTPQQYDCLVLEFGDELEVEFVYLEGEFHELDPFETLVTKNGPTIAGGYITNS